jgi:hypothetical protein
MSSQGGWPAAPPLPPWHPPKDNTRIWVIVGILLGLIALVPVGLFVVGMSVYAGHDHIELIDKPEVVEALAPTCHRVGAAASELKLEGSPEARSAALLSFSAAAREIPLTVESLTKDELDSDIPTTDWAEDWTTLLTELDRYAKDLSAGGQAAIEIPSKPDGFSTLGRMNLASPARGCNVPLAIALLDDDSPRLP